MLFILANGDKESLPRQPLNKQLNVVAVQQAIIIHVAPLTTASAGIAIAVVVTVLLVRV